MWLPPKLSHGYPAMVAMLLLLASSNAFAANGEWFGTRDAIGNVQWDYVGSEIQFPSFTGSAALEDASGPGKFHPNSVCVLDGEWYVAGGERSCGAHGELWKWSGNDWLEVNPHSPQPNPSKPHVAWASDDHLVWLEMDRSLIWHEYRTHSNGWSLDQRTADGEWFPATTPQVLQDYVVWASSNSDLYILSKISGEMAHFPNDAWAYYLLQAERATYLRISAGNVLEFGRNVHRMSRYDFNEKVRFADFKEVFHGEDGPLMDHMGSASALPWALLAMSWCLFLSWHYFRSKTKEAAQGLELKLEQEIDPSNELQSERIAGIAHWSIPLKQLVLSNKKSYSSLEIDELFGLTEIVSPETLRAKRSRMIQTVNTEFNLLFGYDLIRRKREAKDRRKVIYHLSAMPPNLVKLLQRNGMHQLHADHGAYRADGIPEDRE